MTSARLDTPEARARSIRRVLEGRRGIHLEQRFCDRSGAEHEIRSCPVPGGRYLYDDSGTWGLRALGFCRDDMPEQLAALADDYAERCGEEVEPLWRSLRVSDILRRNAAEEAEQ